MLSFYKPHLVRFFSRLSSSKNGIYRPSQTTKMYLVHRVVRYVEERGTVARFGQRPSQTNELATINIAGIPIHLCFMMPSLWDRPSGSCTFILFFVKLRNRTPLRQLRSASEKNVGVHRQDYRSTTHPIYHSALTSSEQWPRRDAVRRRRRLFLYSFNCCKN